MKKSALAYILVALMLSTAIVYFVAAAEESSESGEGEATEQTVTSRNDFDEDEAREATGTSDGGSNMATQVQTGFFAVVGVGYVATSMWMLKDKGRTRPPYLIAIGGSIAIIGLYIASRTVDLPIVGLQDDVGSIDILSKVLQVGIIVVAASIISGRKELKVAPNERQRRPNR